MEVRVHPRVKKYLDESGEKDRLKQGLARPEHDPFRSGLESRSSKARTMRSIA